MELLWWCDDDEAGCGSSGSNFLQFTLKITNEKLDEVAKNENVESGVEDSDD